MKKVSSVIYVNNVSHFVYNNVPSISIGHSHAVNNALPTMKKDYFLMNNKIHIKSFYYRMAPVGLNGGAAIYFHS
jgi:hypothetical protein